MATHPDFPGVSSFTDRHGGLRWRFRNGRRTISFRIGPEHPDFPAHYEAAITGQPLPNRPAAGIHALPTGPAPRSLQAAWIAYRRGSPEWRDLAQVSRDKQDAQASRFLSAPVAGEGGPVWGAMPVADFHRRHVKAVLQQRADTPHAAKNLLVLIRKMMEAALDNEWIDQDPTYRVRWNPAVKGHRPWTFEQLMAFEHRWPPGTTPRLAYALALWLGTRRGDVASLTPQHLLHEVAQIRQGKTGHDLTLPIVPMLEEVLAVTDMSGSTVLMTAQGRPFSEKSLTGRMRRWTAAAGLPSGCVMHGLRKTLGAMAADAEATTREGMSILGHKSVSEFENYSRGADQKRLAASGMAKVVDLWQEKKKRAG